AHRDRDGGAKAAGTREAGRPHGAVGRDPLEITVRLKPDTTYTVRLKADATYAGQERERGIPDLAARFHVDELPRIRNRVVARRCQVSDLPFAAHLQGRHRIGPRV